MFLTELTANLQNDYAAIQIQIEELQEKQRQIQVYLQQLGATESKMVAAFDGLRDVVEEMRSVCPDRIDAFKAAIANFFDKPALSKLIPVTVADDGSESEPTEYGVEVIDDSGLEDASSVPNVDMSVVVNVADATPVETTKKDDAAQPDLKLDAIALNQLNWKTVKQLCSQYHITVNGGRIPIKRFRDYCETQLLGLATASDVVALAG